MKAKRYISLFIITFISTSFVHKDLNEYRKWLNFYDLKNEDFFQQGKNEQLKFEWKSFDEDKKIYDPLFFYSLDSTYFLDLYTYNILLYKDSIGRITWEGGDPESRVQLVRTKDLKSSLLLFYGTTGFFETSIWRGEFNFEILGFTVNENNTYIPTIWKYDFKKGISQVFENKKTFKERPKSYLREVILKSFKEK